MVGLHDGCLKSVMRGPAREVDEALSVSATLWPPLAHPYSAPDPEESGNACNGLRSRPCHCFRKPPLWFGEGPCACNPVLEGRFFRGGVVCLAGGVWCQGGQLCLQISFSKQDCCLRGGTMSSACQPSAMCWVLRVDPAQSGEGVDQCGGVVEPEALPPSLPPLCRDLICGTAHPTQRKRGY